jgi:hypothetical protein
LRGLNEDHSSADKEKLASRFNILNSGFQRLWTSSFQTVSVDELTVVGRTTRPERGLPVDVPAPLVPPRTLLLRSRPSVPGLDAPRIASGPAADPKRADDFVCCVNTTSVSDFFYSGGVKSKPGSRAGKGCRESGKQRRCDRQWEKGKGRERRYGKRHLE